MIQKREDVHVYIRVITRTINIDPGDVMTFLNVCIYTESK